MKFKKQQKKDRGPIAIIFAIIWMFYMILHIIGKKLDPSRLDISKTLYGNFAIFDYFIDFLILIALCIIIFLFIKRKYNSWKYFIYLIGFLIIGVVVGEFLVILWLKNFVTFFQTSKTSFLATTISTSILLILFYLFLIYLVYKNKDYFEK